MPCLENLRNFILRMDLFAAQPILRTRGEAAFETISCGCFSLILILTFVGIFASSFVNILEKVDITASVNLAVTILFT